MASSLTHVHIRTHTSTHTHTRTTNDAAYWTRFRYLSHCSAYLVSVTWLIRSVYRLRYTQKRKKPICVAIPSHMHPLSGEHAEAHASNRLCVGLRWFVYLVFVCVYIGYVIGRAVNPIVFLSSPRPFNIGTFKALILNQKDDTQHTHTFHVHRPVPWAFVCRCYASFHPNTSLWQNWFSLRMSQVHRESAKFPFQSLFQCRCDFG